MTATIARIRFRLPRDRRLNSDLSRLTFTRAELPGDFELVAVGSDPIGKSENLVLRTAALPSIEDANTVGTRAQLAVLIAAARIRLGVDLGKDAPKSMWMQAGLEMMRQQHGLPEDTVVLNDFLGLTLVDASQTTAFVGMLGAQGIVGTPVERFVDAFAEGFELAQFLSPRSQLALELFSASRFEASLRARCLVLVSAIESITTRELRAEDAQQLIAGMKDLFDTMKINSTDREQIAGTLRDLKSRSIAGSSKALVAKHCGREKAKLFGKCYQARSQLVHTGKTTFDLGAHLQQLEELVAETIIGCVRPVA